MKRNVAVKLELIIPNTPLVRLLAAGTAGRGVESWSSFPTSCKPAFARPQTIFCLWPFCLSAGSG